MRLVSIGVKGQRDLSWPPAFRSLAASIQDRMAADNLRLLGSVARGEAIPGESDIDFLALGGPDVPDHLGRREDMLRRAYPVVARVDLEAECLDRLSEFRRLVLSSDSLSVFGTDQLTRPRQYVDRAELARLVTPQTRALIRGYRAAVEDLAANNSDLLSRYARVVGKDLLRCLRQVALLRGGAYEKNIGAIYEQVLALVPEHRSLAEALYALYRDPCAGKDVVLQILDEAAKHLASGSEPTPAVL